jgi:hypothetical protein
LRIVDDLTGDAHGLDTPGPGNAGTIPTRPPATRPLAPVVC